MKTMTIEGHVVRIFDSIDELPITRFHKYNKYLLIDSRIGSDLNDVLARIDRAIRYIGSNKELAVVELENMKQAMFLINETICPRHLAFAALVDSIDGKRITDLSDESMQGVVDTLGKTKTNFIDRFIETVKKKMDEELNLYFPSKFEDANIKEYYDRLKSRMQLMLDKIIRGIDHKEQINEIDDFLLSLSKPRIFWGKDGAEIMFDKQYEDMCLLLAQKLTVDPKKMTVLQFYNAFEYIKKTIGSNDPKE
jgi:hypothetical protein